MRKNKIWSLGAAMSLVVAGLWASPSGAVQTAGKVHAAWAPLTKSEAASLSHRVDQRVIIILKNQLKSTPATSHLIGERRAEEANLRGPVVAELRATKSRGVHAYTVLNAVAATVSAGERAHLAADPLVARVIPDQIIHLAPVSEPQGVGHSRSNAGSTPSTCSTNPAQPTLEPQALSDIHADSSDPNAKTARSLGITGAGVKVAFIADGLDITNPDFQRNAAYASASSPTGSPVFVDFKDFSGEGTSVPTGGGEAFLDAGSIGAQGNQVYDISNYSAIPQSVQCYIKIEGVAPGASLVGLDIFGAEDAGYNSSFLQAIDYAVTDGVNVLNESLGSNPYPDDQASLDAIKMANDAAVAAGVTVTASSGDAGVTGTQGSPSTDPNVIGVGASTTYEVDSDIGYGGFQFAGVKGYLNDNISGLSSSGFQQNGATVSLVAPGELNWTLCSPNTALWSECTNMLGNPSPIQESGGTSESAPLTAGVAALVDQAYAKTHGGTFPTPAVVKQIITSTADDIMAPGELQGSGLLDAYRAVLAAEAYQVPAPEHTPATLIESTSQFNLVGHSDDRQTVTEQLTNVGSTGESVQLSSRTLGVYHQISSATVTLSDTASPQSVDYQGYTDNYESVHFWVPRGVDRLSGSIAYQGASSALSSRVRLALITPSGQLADYSVPQGVGNYGNAQVTNPAAGEWTAYIWSRDTAGGGTTGPVLFGASVANYHDFGTVWPSQLYIPAGATRSVNLSVSNPDQPGDTAGSLVVSSSSQASLAIPVTLRTLVASGRTQFSGVLTGGNGREATTGVTDYYQVNVHPGDPALNASVTLADNPNNQVYAWLIDPSGQAQAFQSNDLITLDSSNNLNETAELGTNLHVTAPMPGRWTLIVLFAPTVSGTALSEPFTVSMNEDAPQVSTQGLTRHQTISATNGTIVYVNVRNNGTAPESYFIDGRLNELAQYDLPAFTTNETSVPLNYSSPFPVYDVPSETVALNASATTSGTEPIQFDLGGPSGDPDIASNQGLNVSAQLTGSPISSGAWDIAPTTVGPWGATGATSEDVSTDLVATTQAFDPAVASTTGDLQEFSVGGPFTVTPVVVQPGQSVSIPVQIMPTAPVGSKVSGTLYLDDDSLVLFGGLFPNANTVAAIPYSYTVGQ